MSSKVPETSPSWKTLFIAPDPTCLQWAFGSVLHADHGNGCAIRGQNRFVPTLLEASIARLEEWTLPGITAYSSSFDRARVTAASQRSTPL
jgi:hypothetical protein